MSTQQRETYEFFNAIAADWRERAEGRKADKVNVIAQRNNAALRTAAALGRVERALDIGCGTGELVIDLAARGIRATGVDFAPDMIALCEAKRREAGLGNADFVAASIFDHPMPPASFDLITGMGLIEYVSAEELDRLIRLCAAALRPGGAVVFGSRNRLFNVFSLSAYTELELRLGTVADLTAEALVLARSASQGEALAALRGIATAYPPASNHPLTDIGVNTRHQYTPSEMLRLFEKHGLVARTIFPVHFHALAVPVHDRFKPLNVSVAGMLNEAAPEDHRLVPQSSSYVMRFDKVSA